MDLRRVKYNFKISTLEGMFANLGTGLVAPFLGVYAIHLGASNMLVGSLTALPALANVLFMVLAARIVGRRRLKLPLIVRSALVSRFFFLGMALIPFVPAWGPELLVGIVIVMTIPAVLFQVAWTDLVARIFPADRRAEIFGSRGTWCGLVGLAGTLAGGYLLDRVAFPANYMWLFVVAWLFYMASVGLLGKMSEEPSEEESSTDKPYVQQVRAMLSDPQFGGRFKVFMLGSFLLHAGIYFSMPIWTIYFVRELHLSNSFIGWINVLNGATSVLFLWPWGKVAKRRGDDYILAVAMGGLAVFPLIFVLSTNPAYILAVQATAGLFAAGFNLTVFNMLIGCARDEYKPSSIASFYVLIGVAGFVAPFAGTAVLDFVPARVALGLSSGIRLIGFVFFLRGIGSALRPRISSSETRLPATP